MAEEVVTKEIRSCTQSTEDWEHLKLKIKLKQPGEWLGGEFRGYLIPHPPIYILKLWSIMNFKCPGKNHSSLGWIFSENIMFRLRKGIDICATIFCNRDAQFIKHMDKTEVNVPLSKHLTKQASHPYSQGLIEEIGVHLC